MPSDHHDERDNCAQTSNEALKAGSGGQNDKIDQYRYRWLTHASRICKRRQHGRSDSPLVPLRMVLRSETNELLATFLYDPSLQRDGTPSAQQINTDKHGQDRGGSRGRQDFSSRRLPTFRPRNPEECLAVQKQDHRTRGVLDSDSLPLFDDLGQRSFEQLFDVVPESTGTFAQPDATEIAAVRERALVIGDRVLDMDAGRHTTGRERARAETPTVDLIFPLHIRRFVRRASNGLPLTPPKKVPMNAREKEVMRIAAEMERALRRRRRGLS